jgi:hypothetical protein
MRIHVRPAVDADEVIRLWDEGLTARQIARRLDASYRQVLCVLRKARSGLLERYRQTARKDGVVPERLAQFLDEVWAEIQTLQRCPACFRRATVKVLDLGPMGWIAKCSRTWSCGFLWFRQHGPPSRNGLFKHA